MSFQGADVDGLDRTANRCMEGADFADTVARALEILVAALEAMSWTGFAAALAAYLKAVVIPWVKYIAKCLRIFGGLLQLASGKQKDASEDYPQITIPATAWNPPPAPTAVGIEPPLLSTPSPAIQQTDPGTGAQTGGGTSVAPTTPITRTDAGGTGTGGGTVTTVTGIGADGKLWTRTSIGGVPTGGGTASGPGVAIDGCFGDGSVGSGGGSASGSAGNSGSASGPVGRSLGSGSSGGLVTSGSAGSSGSTGGPVGGSSGGALGGGSGSSPGSGEGSGTTAGETRVHSTPLLSRPAMPLATGGVGTGSIAAAAPVEAGGASSAMLAAPLGLAGVGTAALAALRAKADKDDDAEGDDAI